MLYSVFISYATLFVSYSIRYHTAVCHMTQSLAVQEIMLIDVVLQQGQLHWDTECLNIIKNPIDSIEKGKPIASIK